MKFSTKFVVGALGCLLQSLLASTGLAQDITIETYGDSLTAGFLSGTNVTAAPPLDVLSKIWSDLVMFKMSGDRKYLAPHHRADLAWPAQLAKSWKTGGINVSVKNYAVSEDRTKDLLQQLKGARPTEHAASFFFIGHNDLCDNNDSPEAIGAQFAKEYGAALKAWDEKNHGATAYLVPVGDIYRVYKLLEGVVWHNRSGRSYRCDDSWTKFFPYCTSYYKMLKAGTLEETLAPRINAMNAALENLAKDWTKNSKRNRFKSITNMQAKPYEKDYFAVDCFHLSDVGQAAIAENFAKEIGNP